MPDLRNIVFPEPEENLDELYPPDDRKLIAVTGSVTSGFQFWGPFDTMKQAVAWAESKQWIYHKIVIDYLKGPESE